MALAAPHAAKVIYSFGDVKATGKSGSRELEKGDMVYSGETVATTRGRAQIKFTDGGFASLQPNTDYQIDEYNYEGKADGNERSFLNLIKGSVRLVTGVIGKANRRNFRIKTAVATIGIRGTTGTITHNQVSNTTMLKGHGGVWDLKSGDFTGGVPAGQAYSCNGVSCAQIAGLPQRSEVGRGKGRASRRQRERGYQQGQQTAPDGRICDLGSACSDLVLNVNQAGAGVNFSYADFNSVTIGEKPVALIGTLGTDAFGTSFFSAAVTDVAALRSAVMNSNDEDFIAAANEFLDALDPASVAELEANPATVADSDFFTTSEGVTIGRWELGNVLTGNSFMEPILFPLENFQSVHFAYGSALQNFEFLGTGYYSLTAATFPTAVNGSSIGEMPSSGSLTWYFGFGQGEVALPVIFDGKQFNVTGSLNGFLFSDSGDVISRAFLGNGEARMLGSSMTYATFLSGFFTGDNGGSAPLGAGLTYQVFYDPNPFEGVAAFGLVNQIADAPTLQTIVYAFNFEDGAAMPFSTTRRGLFDTPMPLASFSTSGGNTFDQGLASPLEAATESMTGAHFRSFSTGYTFNGNFLEVPSPTLVDRFHVVGADFTTPANVVLSQSGSATFSRYNSTSPTILHSSGLADVGVLDTADFVANFTTGSLDVTFSGHFTSLDNLTFTASGNNVPINRGFVPLVGTAIDGGATGSIGCSATCSIDGSTNYAFASAFPGGPPRVVISAFEIGGVNISTIPFQISGAAISKRP
ncbi:MAG: FecR family protein [Pseudomonadota bacterium]